MIDIVGESFLWQMVRRIVSALDLVDKGDLDLRGFEDLLSPDIFSNIEPFPPEGLTLMDIKYEGITFKEDSRGKEYIRAYMKKKNLSFYSSLEVSEFLSKT